MTQPQVGRSLGVSFQSVQKYETGLSRVTPTLLLRFSRLYGVPVASLLEDDPDTTGLTAPGVELRDLRRSAGLTQRHIAEITGTTRQNVANLERRGGALRIDWLIELAKMTGRHPWSLVDPEMIELSPEERKLILRLRDLKPPQRAAALAALEAALPRQRAKSD